VKIVVGYDGSEHSQRALERAAALASADDGAVTVVSVASALLGGARSVGVAEGELGHAASALEEARTRLAQRGLEAELVEGLGDPGHEIVEVAKRVGADLVVVGTRSRDLLERLLLGSVSTDVVHHAPCDVLVVR
jgi:nucleotide-binding universal stress UspA family protein